MNSTRNLAADDLQLLVTNAISIVSTAINFIGFYVIIMQKSRESKSFTYVQLLYQVVLYGSQFYAGTVLNIVFLFPVPGIYCIGWLRNLSGYSALYSLILFDVLFSLQGLLLIVILVIKVGAISRPNSALKMTPRGQNLFLAIVISYPIITQVITFIFSYSDRSEVALFLGEKHPLMIFLLRYPFLWMLTTTQHFVAFLSNIFVCIGVVFMIFVIFYAILLVELDLQVNSMSRASNKYHRRVIHEIVVHIDQKDRRLVKMSSFREALLLLLLVSISTAQRLITLSSFKGNSVKMDCRHVFYNLDSLKNRKLEQNSDLLSSWPVNSTAYITTSLSDDVMSQLTGFIYITTAKQLQDDRFFVYDVAKSSKVQVDRTIIGNSTLMFLNTNLQTNPVQTSVISGWLQTEDSVVKMYKGFPTDDQETPSSQIFSNPVQTVGNEMLFIRKVEKFAVSLGAFYFKTQMDLLFYIEPKTFSINGLATTAYTSTGFYMKPRIEKEHTVTVMCIRDTRYNGTTGANVIANLTMADSKVTVQENDGRQSSSISVTSANQILGWNTDRIGSNVTISSDDASTGGEYFVQYYIKQDQQISSTTASGAATTTVSVETTTRSGSSLRFFIAFVIANLI
ncbi:unnamed protein product [Caenorhabditis sp. 36 PRJEB53466]|nr:unnamed protein product [Caenorhabditis sp. 36 PRJEB53466]